MSWLAAEAVYGYDRNTQRYFGSGTLARVQANVHQVTGGFVVLVPTVFSFSPYPFAEGGALVFDPTGNRFGTVAGTSSNAAGVFAYGGGADFRLNKHVTLRAEYRGLVYNTPDFWRKNDKHQHCYTHGTAIGRCRVSILRKAPWCIGMSRKCGTRSATKGII